MLLGVLQDALMVVYLSNLAKTQIAIAEKINAEVGSPSRALMCRGDASLKWVLELSRCVVRSSAPLTFF